MRMSFHEKRGKSWECLQLITERRAGWIVKSFSSEVLNLKYLSEQRISKKFLQDKDEKASETFLTQNKHSI